MEKAHTLEQAAELIAKDQTYCWHPFSQAETAPQALPVIKAKGAELTLGDGSTLIDAISSWWVTLHGHGHPLINQAIIEQLNHLDHVMFADLTHQPAVDLAERLTQLLPGNLQRIFFSDNGSTAVETALKIVLQAWGDSTRKKPRHKIVAFHGGYHGETFGAMAVSSRDLFSKPFSSHLFPVEFIAPPKKGEEESSCAQLKRLLEKGEIAGFIFEPGLQGAGGMIPHSLEGLSELIRLCKEQGVLTIADEVFTGCGRTGPYFSTDHLSEFPDIICLAKSLTGGTVPLGITACSENIFRLFLAKNWKKAFLHGHSFCANPVACAAALASLDLLVSKECDRQRNFIEGSHSHFASKCHGWKQVKRVDVVGTLLAIELKTKEKGGYFHRLRDTLINFFLSRGVLIRPLGNTLYVLPPYCTDQTQLKQIYETIEESFEFLGWMH